MDKFLQGMLALDRRWIYLVLIVVFITTLILGRPVNPVILPPVQQLYDAVNRAPAGEKDGKIIVVAIDFEAGSLGENGNQARVLLRHLMLAHKRFAIYSIAPQGTKIGHALAENIARQYGRAYGTDWIDFGYVNMPFAFYKTIISDIPQAVPVDAMLQKPIGSFPIMKGIKSTKDVSLFVEVTTYGVLDDVIAIVQPATKPRLNVGYACTGINATSAYTYLDSGQLVGMMPGLKGAADYEKLVDNLEDQEIKTSQPFAVANKFDYNAPTALRLPDPARKLMFTQGAAHIVILLFILIGNVGLILTRLRARAREKKGVA